MGYFSWTAIFLGITAAILASINTPVFRKRPHYKLTIGILSARHNFIQRNVIRSTWLSVLSDKKLYEKVNYKFVLANKDCEIPLQYRISEYSCKAQRSWLKDLDSISLNRNGCENGDCKISQYPVDHRTVGYDFAVIFDVIVSGFVLPVQSCDETIIQLWDLASDVLVLEARPEHEMKTNSSWRRRDVHPHLLPKGFIGSVIVICGSKCSCVGVQNWLQYTDMFPAIEINPIVRYSKNSDEFPENVIPVATTEMALPALMLMKIADVLEVSQHLEDKEESFKRREEEMEEIKNKLQEEMHHHGDILLLSDTNGDKLNEVYVNLPRKVVSFHHWCDEQLSSEYIMKTDDDSYVDIEKVLQTIEKAEKNSKTSRTWLGNFRRNWNVDRWGKWAELRYTANVYPAYACGAGSVVSSDLSKFLSNNRNYLRYYQGEDVSAGIWFSSLDANHIQNDNWLCDDNCKEDMIVSTQHSPSSLLRLWNNRKHCGNPCVCDNET